MAGPGPHMHEFLQCMRAFSGRVVLCFERRIAGLKAHTSIAMPFSSAANCAFLPWCRGPEATHPIHDVAVDTHHVRLPARQLLTLSAARRLRSLPRGAIAGQPRSSTP